jgi:hypothetical protein
MANAAPQHDRARKLDARGRRKHTDPGNQRLDKLEHWF